MNSKHVNRLFLSVVLMHFVLIAVLIVSSPFFSLGILGNLLASQMVILVPAIISFIVKKEKINFKELGFCRLRFSTALLVVVYTLLCLPLITVVNALSMLFVDNTVVALSSEILSVPFPAAFFMIALFGPFSEEFVFRGVMFHGYKRDGNVLGAVLLSALTFSFMHMNFNQAGYAFVIGIALAFIMLATGSFLAPMIMHFIINAQSVCMMYLTEKMMPGSLAADAAAMTKDDLLMTIGIYSVIAAVTTVLAICLLIYIADREGHKEDLCRLLEKPENVKRRITPALIIALFIAFVYMLFEAVLTMMM